MLRSFPRMALTLHKLRMLAKFGRHPFKFELLAGSGHGNLRLGIQHPDLIITAIRDN